MTPILRNLAIAAAVLAGFTGAVLVVLVIAFDLRVEPGLLLLTGDAASLVDTDGLDCQLLLQDGEAHVIGEDGGVDTALREEPLDVLRAMENIEILPLRESDWCCGSAGSYNLTQTDISMKLLDRKMGHVQSAGAPVLCTGNPGCQIQIGFGARERGMGEELARS